MSATVYLTTPDGQLKLDSAQPQDASTTCTLDYLNEGGANFVFRLLPAQGQTRPPTITGKLLRLRKDFPHVQSTTEQLQDFDQHFKPLFPPEHIIEHTLVQLAGSIPRLLNQSLQHLDRPSHRGQDSLPLSETHGLLITDMTPKPDSTLLQLKPKWLSQSPNAPANAKRCRTCALRAQRASQQIRTATDKQASCPLALVSERVQDRQRAAEAVTRDAELRHLLAHEVQPLLQLLRQWQIDLDRAGVLNAASADASAVRDLCKAMTLRDCTLFARRSNGGGNVEVRLGDLDLKQASQTTKWCQVERSLIGQGWYMNGEDPEVWVDEDICLLSRALK
ncbi:hypothetical protein LTR08_002349 [Meristemomyces frigidus]|nr:hypothetical protein LTR08_002349 [Meristemomyces frigidus]